MLPPLGGPRLTRVQWPIGMRARDRDCDPSDGLADHCRTEHPAFGRYDPIELAACAAAHRVGMCGDLRQGGSRGG
jgi:hypothetical protein